jgi:hypothetical protein
MLDSEILIAFWWQKKLLQAWHLLPVTTQQHSIYRNRPIGHLEKPQTPPQIVLIHTFADCCHQTLMTHPPWGLNQGRESAEHGRSPEDMESSGEH